MDISRNFLLIIPLIVLLIISAFLKEGFLQGGKKTPVSYSGSNVVLISIDTLRADRLGAYGYPKNTSPFLDQLAGESIVFDDAYSTATSTRNSHMAMLSGRFCISANTHLDDSKLISEILKEQGYATAAFVDGGQMNAVYGFDKGFDLYFDPHENEFDNPRKQNAFSKWLNENKNKKFFAFLHFYDIHSPYESKEPYTSIFIGNHLLKNRNNYDYLNGLLGLTTDKKGKTRLSIERIQKLPPEVLIENMELISGLYDAQIPIFDNETLRPFINLLVSSGTYNKTIIIITADHGESLGEINGKINHGHLFPHEFHVPLVIHLPDKQSRRTDYPASSMDIAPTILDLLDIKTQKNFDGISLKKAMFEDLGPTGRVRIGVNGFGEGYLCSNEKEAITLTNIGKLSKTLTNNYNKTKLAELTHECQKTISQMNQRKKPTNTTTTIAISEELKKELKDLGYLI